LIVEPGDHSWFVEDLNNIRNNFGGAIEFIDIQMLDITEVEKRLADADVIYVAGGNTDYLSNTFEKTSFIKLLPKLLETKVYVGSSAGSSVLGHRPSAKTFVENYEEKQFTDKYHNFLDLVILPHLNSPYFNTRGEGWAIEDSKTEPVPVYALSDNAAVIVEDEQIYVIGKDYLVVKNGEMKKRG